MKFVHMAMSSMSLFIYAYEQKCKQWHQQGFYYNNRVFDSNVIKHPVFAHYVKKKYMYILVL